VPELSQLTRQKPTEAVADFGDGDVVKIIFNVNKITPAWLKEAQVRDDSLDPESLPKALLDVIISWDVLDNGVPTQPSLEILDSFSYPVQNGLLTAILKAAVPSSEEGNDSSAPASSPAPVSSMPASASTPNGATSPSPTPSESLQPT